MAIRSQLLPSPFGRTRQFQGWIELADEHGILARAEVEVDGAALEVAIPKFELQTESRLPSEICSEAVQLAKKLAGDQSVKFIRTVVRDDQSDFAIWEAALVRGGFQHLSAKRLWIKEPSGKGIRSPLAFAMGVEIATIGDDLALDRLYSRIAVESLDRADAFEADRGIALGARSGAVGARAGGKLVGMCAWELSRSNPDAWLAYIGVEAGYRRRHIATDMFAALLREVPEALGRVRALIDTENLPSAELHRSLGFEPSGHVGRYYYWETRAG